MILELAFGTCAVVELADDRAVDAAVAALPDAEQALAVARGPVRRRDLVAGRTALHAALGGGYVGAILSDDRGAPAMPAGFTGSISHKDGRAAALVAPRVDADAPTIGVDFEAAAPSRVDIARRVLTAREQAAVAGLDAIARGRAVTLRFAIKEAIYKAIDPWVRRYVAFTEVELEVGAADAVVGVTVLEPEKLPVVIEATWREHEGHWLATARARPRLS